MKALRKKYGKRRWEDTPNAAWWRKSCQLRKARFAIMANALGYQSHAQVQAIRSTPVSDQMSAINKNIALAEAVIASQNAVAEIWNDYGKPPAKNRSRQNANH